MKQFETVPIKKPAANVFNLSHDVKSTYNFDKVYPFFCELVNPSETFNVRAEFFLRAMPLKCPVMHNVDLHAIFVGVPCRLLWNEKRKEDFRTFITGGEKGNFGCKGYDNLELDYVLPHFRYNQFDNVNLTPYITPGSLADHLGFATLDSAAAEVSADRDEPFCSLPFRAYQFVWNEIIRNQNLQNEIEFSFGSGQETEANLKKLFTLRRKCFEKDYFTACLPFQQRGEAVLLPISFNQGEPQNIPLDVQVDDIYRASDDQVVGALQGVEYSGQVNVFKNYLGVESTYNINQQEVYMKGSASISSEDLNFTGLSVGTISDLRYCLRLQQWFENNARCGSRYIEQLLAHFGVMSSDARLQRPEILGGGKIPLLFSDVPQTSETTDSSVQGNLAGKGTLYGKTSGFKKYFEEHTIILGLLAIIPRTSYSQGISRKWAAMDKTNWYWPEFAHLSEQAVLNHEIYYDPTADNDDDESLNPMGVFGYIGRFDEYRYIPSSVHGEMKTDLQYWHLGRLFSSLPRLNSDFVEAHTRANIFALDDISDGTYDPFVCQIHLDVKAVRPMPKFAVPSM